MKATAAGVPAAKMSATLGRDVMVQDKRAPKAKGKSAFEIFRARWIAQQKLTSDSFNRVCVTLGMQLARHGPRRLEISSVRR